MSDLLGDAGWWVHPVRVQRYLGKSQRGDVWAEPVTVTGFYSDKRMFEADQLVASGRFAYPASVDPIPLQSKVTLPAVFGGRTVRVTQAATGDGGGQPTPDHQMIGVL